MPMERNTRSMLWENGLRACSSLAYCFPHAGLHFRSGVGKEAVFVGRACHSTYNEGDGWVALNET